MRDFDFFDLIVKNWTRPFKEVSGYKTIETSDGYLIVVNALGIDKKDLEVKLQGNTLNITGTTEIEEINFNNNVSFKFDLSRVIRKLDGIQYEVKNGLAYIYLNIKPEEKPDIQISYKD